MSLHLENNFICFTLTDMLNFDENMIEAKDQDVKIQTSEKWTNCESIPFQNLLIAHHILHICNMSNKMVMGIVRR